MKVSAFALAVAVGYGIHAARASGIPAAGALLYSGTLTDSNGSPLANPQTLGVAVYATAIGGAPVCQRALQSTPLDAQGHFQVPMPDSCTTAVSANPDLWVEVSLASGSLGRTKIGAVPYAVETTHAVSANTAISATTASNAAHATSADQATSAGTAANATGDITPRSVSVAGRQVIDATGAWVGAPVGVLGSVDYAQTAPLQTFSSPDADFHWIPVSTDAAVTMAVRAGDEVMLTGTLSIFPNTTAAADPFWWVTPCYRATAQSVPVPFGLAVVSAHNTMLAGANLNYRVLPVHGTMSVATAGSFQFGVCIRNNGNVVTTNPAASLVLQYTALRF